MCGIAGWIDWQMDLREQKPILQDMTKALAHRGPDDEGLFISEFAGLGHRRLAVIDPARGKQPMIRYCQGNTYVIVYNGELYNTQDLRQDLQDLGHDFSSHSDTEVLLVSFIQWGIDCVHKLNGIYAFAIWDENNKQLFMARDRLGVKPLFYAHRDKSFYFASEPKSLLVHPQIEATIDGEGLAEIFLLGPARTPGHGIYKDMHELKPGNWLLYSDQGVKTKSYWSLENQTHEDDLPTTAAKLHDFLKDAVQRQLVSDVPLCTFLSGGLDSSAITALAVNHWQNMDKGILPTFSVSYEGNAANFQANHFQPDADDPWIKKATKYLETDHHSITLSIHHLVEALDTAVWANDRPGMADIDSSLYLFCQQVKKKSTVALSGESADEIFGGYPWFRDGDALGANTFPWSLSAHKRTEIISPELQKKLRPEQYLGDNYAQALAQVPRLPGESKTHARIRELYYLNITRFMPTLLDRKDRMSMAVGLEVRVPFCDHRLVQYGWNIPSEIKDFGNREKGILRLALQTVLPNDLVMRKKSPYPKTHHPLYLKLVKQRLQDIIEDTSSPIIPLINRKRVKELLELEDVTDIKPWFGQLMTGPQLFAYLIQVNTWLKNYHVTIA